MLDYISRVKKLRSAIFDGECRAQLRASTITEIDQLTAKLFCQVLSLKFRILDVEFYFRPFEAFAAAKALAIQDELERQRYSDSLGSEVYGAKRGEMCRMGDGRILPATA